MRRPDNLTTLHVSTLIKFAERTGRNWRSALQSHWGRESSVGTLNREDLAVLQELRNTMAPEVGRMTLRTLHEWGEADRYSAAAQRIHGDEGQVEIDDRAPISRGEDPGAYVQAWVWVPESEL